VKRGELYRVHKPTKDDPKRSRVFVVVSRQALVDANLSTVICAPVYSSYHSLGSQVLVGVDEGLKDVSSIHCDKLVSLPKSELTNYVGSLSETKIVELNQALRVALELPDVS
jgi:mRNA interferase MazF